jgi:predicted ATPase with chaperone activity
VARTIADLAGTRAVEADHLEEAARYRSPVATLAVREAS